MEHISKLRTYLAIAMREYCRRTGKNIITEINSFYNKHNITSRAELTESQLEEAIASYRAWIKYEEPNPIETAYQALVDRYEAREKKGTWSTWMQDVVQYLLDHPGKIWHFSYELIEKTNSKWAFLSHRAPARASDLAIHHADIVEDRKIGRLAVYRLRVENQKEIERFLLSAQK
jgi:hypothetical protein